MTTPLATGQPPPRESDRAASGETGDLNLAGASRMVGDGDDCGLKGRRDLRWPSCGVTEFISTMVLFPGRDQIRLLPAAERE
ncbi:MAG: hypothetical protein M3304_07755 [Actinomycetota bacterium]|nr:hypothetical protein [Actinomycetota bacterium]